MGAAGVGAFGTAETAGLGCNLGAAVADCASQLQESAGFAVMAGFAVIAATADFAASRNEAEAAVFAASRIDATIPSKTPP
jgi:hypothetical protein